MTIIISHDNYNTISELKRKIDIVSLIGETIQLKRKGNRYWGLCPFHKEKTPSFSVDPEKQLFRCFSCGAHGDALDFVMNLYSLNFTDARQWLAHKYGLEITPSDTKKFMADRQQRQREGEKEDCLKDIINQQYARLCTMERLLYRIINGIQTEADLDKPAVIWALATKDIIGHFLDILIDGSLEQQLEIALYTRGAAI